MDASATTKEDAHQISYLTELPTELLLRIGNYTRKDPNISIVELRKLRLVCKTFDAVWSHLVNLNLLLLPKGPDSLLQLRYLVEGTGKAHSDAYTTITIKNLRSLETAGASSQDKDVYTVGQAKKHVTSLPHKLDLPNVRCARLLYDHKESEWSISHSTKILLSLKNLTELELCIHDDTDVKHLFRCLEPLAGLQKLTLLPSKVTPSQARAVGNLIARNTTLTHFTCGWQPAHALQRVDPFVEVPSKKPLKLEHLSLSSHCTNLQTLLPHVQTLTSVDFHSMERNTWCTAFTRAQIFPPTIKVDCLDSELVTYVGVHTKIVHLTITANAVSIDSYTGTLQYPSLFKTLVKHCGILKYLYLNTRILPVMLQTAPERLSFLRCVIDLEEIVIVNDKTLAEYPDPESIIRDEKRILPVISLGRTLTLRIRSKDKSVYSQCVEFCRKEASNPLLQDLIGRIVHEDLDS